MEADPLVQRILIVDDEPDLTELLNFQLRYSGFEVATAGGGRAAFTLFQQGVFDLVVSDIRMPNGDGLELLRSIRKSERPGVPVILMTGFADTDAKGAEALGATAFLNKPFHLEELLEVVNAHLPAARSEGA
jgi:DNA-binding response OmpR family regulator